MPNQPTGFTRSELDLIHATAAANGLHIDACSVVVPDDSSAPIPGGGPRPEVARILADLNRDTHQAPATAGPRAAAGSAGRAAGGGAVRSAKPSAGSASAQAVVYDRAAYDLEASRRFAAVSVDQAVDEAGPEAIAGDGTEAGRG